MIASWKSNGVPLWGWVASLVVLLNMGHCVAVADEPELSGIERNRYLLLDSRIIGHTENAELTLGRAKKSSSNPLFEEDKPWEVRFDNLYANVMFDEEEGIYKCWYSPFIKDISSKGMTISERKEREYAASTREMAICYATSKDGINWVKPELGVVEFEGSKANNILWRGTPRTGSEKGDAGTWAGPHGSGIFKDLREPDPNRRYKALIKYEILSVAFSPDGIHWDEAIACPEADSAGDTHNNAFWAPTLGKYVGITREWGEPFGRQVARTTSEDFINWEKCEIVLEGIDPRYQTYSMPVFYHGGIYLGLVAIHDQEDDLVWTELTWSPDTIKWNRVLPGTPFIGNDGKEGDYDWGCVYAAAGPVFLEDEIRLYYGGSDGHHNIWRNGYFCLATLRPDGFAGYKQTETIKSATLRTTAISPGTGPLQVSADIAEVGYVKLRVFDENNEQIAESEPLHGLLSDEEISWQNGFNASEQEKIKIEFEFQHATIYSFNFGN
ncbi:glycoside hydrolase family protein [Bythopirellula goksoeyrii]|uniref:Glycosyl hydrolase family 32 N-terminal domain-containing protein n=1 Tax=Bythopirellula goksoeyrii TaxID=1400387 RepID=A0A5B9QII0_9BACT|nr:hypothetical protein [Bythopirellula goksoeyrii]QEG37400.1 hypothetical protein Pr1d_47430 [Bythopirellula goksoeyrii]